MSIKSQMNDFCLQGLGEIGRCQYKFCIKRRKMKYVLRGEDIYQKIKDILEPAYKGKIVAIEPESGDYLSA